MSVSVGSVVKVQRVRLSADGYGRGGAYYGVGAPLYEITIDSCDDAVARIRVNVESTEGAYFRFSRDARDGTYFDKTLRTDESYQAIRAAIKQAFADAGASVRVLT